MPYRVIAFLWKSPSLTASEFKLYYDTKHLPLVRSLIGDGPFPNKHTRHYVTGEGRGTGSMRRSGPEGGDGNEEPLSCDVVAELEFDDEQHYKSFVGACFAQSDEIRKKIEEDMAKFLRLDKTTVLSVGETSVMTT